MGFERILAKISKFEDGGIIPCNREEYRKIRLNSKFHLRKGNTKIALRESILCGQGTPKYILIDVGDTFSLFSSTQSVYNVAYKQVVLGFFIFLTGASYKIRAVSGFTKC